MDIVFDVVNVDIGFDVGNTPFPSEGFPIDE